MTRKEPRKAKILPIHLEEAAALKRLYDRTVKISQGAFGAEYGLGTQGNVWQYLNGHSPLNASAAVKFAKALSVDVRDFSPRLADEIGGLATGIVDAESLNSDHAPIDMVDAKASAGHGELVMSQDITKQLMFRRDWLAKHGAKPDTTAAFPVRGDSMVDMHIIDGAVVLVNLLRREPISKRIYVIRLNGELYVKQLIKRDGLWYARSHNGTHAETYPDILINDQNSHVIGQAFWCGFEI